MMMCSICHDNFRAGKGEKHIVLVKHEGDKNINKSRQRKHYFHEDCIREWLETSEQHICPLDRDVVTRIYDVPNYEVVGFDIDDYNSDFQELLVNHNVPDRLVDLIIDVETLDKNCRTIAYYACRYGNYSLVDKLVRRRANFNVQTGRNNTTPLMAAVIHNQREIVKKLLSSKVVQESCGCQDDFGKTAFTYACELHHRGIIVEFLNKELINSAEVLNNLRIYRSSLKADKMFGEEIIGDLCHYARQLELKQS